MDFVRTGIVFAFAILLSAPIESRAQVSQTPCEARMFEGDPFTVCRFVAGDDRLLLQWRDADGKPLRQLSRLKIHLGGVAKNVLFATNAGMFDSRHAPIGLYVENGQQQKAISTRDGYGNFHLKPNGVFWAGQDGRLHVTATAAYLAAKPKPKWATQSGPMLVIDGKLHPKISHDGESRYIRNGVGVRDDGDALFVISDAPVSFGRLARLFRDELDCDDALYFDGAVSALWAPSLKRMDSGRDLGPMVVVTSP